MKKRQFRRKHGIFNEKTPYGIDFEDHQRGRKTLLALEEGICVDCGSTLVIRTVEKGDRSEFRCSKCEWSGEFGTQNHVC